MIFFSAILVRLHYFVSGGLISFCFFFCPGRNNFSFFSSLVSFIFPLMISTRTVQNHESTNKLDFFSFFLFCCYFMVHHQKQNKISIYLNIYQKLFKQKNPQPPILFSINLVWFSLFFSLSILLKFIKIRSKGDNVFVLNFCCCCYFRWWFIFGYKNIYPCFRIP